VSFQDYFFNTIVRSKLSIFFASICISFNQIWIQIGCNVIKHLHFGHFLDNSLSLVMHKNAEPNYYKYIIYFQSIFFTRGVSQCGLAIYNKSILRQKKNYGNSNISLCKNIIFKKSSKTNQNPSRYYNFIMNLKFQYQSNYHILQILT